MRSVGGRTRRAAAEEGGQSLVEVALCLPLLLLIVIGIVDVGRIYAYKVAVTNAAREAAVVGRRAGGHLPARSQ
jgi:Flp pilus assembly protein TadG